VLFLIVEFLRQSRGVARGICVVCELVCVVLEETIGLSTKRTNCEEEFSQTHDPHANHSLTLTPTHRHVKKNQYARSSTTLCVCMCVVCVWVCCVEECGGGTPVSSARKGE